MFFDIWQLGRCRWIQKLVRGMGTLQPPDKHQARAWYYVTTINVHSRQRTVQGPQRKGPNGEEEAKDDRDRVERTRKRAQDEGKAPAEVTRQVAGSSVGKVDEASFCNLNPTIIYSVKALSHAEENQQNDEESEDMNVPEWPSCCNLVTVVTRGYVDENEHFSG